MNVGLIQVTSRYSPTNCGVKKKSLVKKFKKKMEKKQYPVQQMILEHLVKEAGSGSGWRTFHSFLCTQVVKEFTRLWRQKHEREM